MRSLVIYILSDIKFSLFHLTNISQNDHIYFFLVHITILLFSCVIVFYVITLSFLSLALIYPFSSLTRMTFIKYKSKWFRFLYKTSRDFIAKNGSLQSGAHIFQGMNKMDLLGTNKNVNMFIIFFVFLKIYILCVYNIISTSLSAYIFHKYI